MEVAAVDYAVCRSCPNGAMLAGGRGSRPDRCAAACGRACLAKLETAGKLSNKFEFPFRKREPWALGHFSRPVDVKDGVINPGTGGCAKKHGKN
jgi:hypothetical protein